MKKVYVLITAIVLTLLLSACDDTPDTFKLQNFNVYSVKILVDDKVQYDTKYNIETTNKEVFKDTKEMISKYTLTIIKKDLEVCASSDTSNATLDFYTSEGSIIITQTCYMIDDEETVVSLLDFGNGTVYTENSLFDDLEERLN